METSRLFGICGMNVDTVEEISLRNIFLLVFKSVSYLFLSTFIITISSFLFWVCLANKFDPSLFGQTRTIFTVVSIIAIFFQFGLPTYNQVQYSKENNIPHDKEFITILKIILLISFLIVASIYYYFSRDRFSYLLFNMIVFIIFFDDLIKYFSAILYGKNEFLVPLKAVIYSRIFFILLLATLFLFSTNIYHFILLVLVTYFIHFIFIYFRLGEFRIEYKKLRFNNRSFQNYLLVLSPLWINNIFNQLYDKIDIPIISYFLNYTQVADYSVAYTFYNLSGIIIGIVLVPLLNYFSNKKIILENKLRLLKKSIIVVLSISISIVILFILVVENIVIMIFGNKYIKSAEMIKYFSLSIIFWNLNSLTGVFLNSQEMFKSTMIAVIVGFLTNILLDIFTIPILGIKGGIIATTVTAFVVLIIETFFIIKIFRNENRIPG